MTVRQLGLSAAVACLLAPPAAAQTSSPPPSTSPDEMTTITVTGCVQRDTTPPASSAREAIGTTGARPDSPFILVDARGKTGTAATPDAEVITAAVTSYRLAGGGNEVAQNIGRRVQIAGTVDKRDAAIAPAVKGPAGEAALPKLTITLLTPADGACSK